MKETFYYKSFKWQIILGILWCLIGSAYLINNGFDNVLGYAYVSVGLLWFVIYFHNGKRRAITFLVDKLIVHNQADLFNRKILLNEIKSIELRPLIVRVTTKSDKTYDLQKDEFDSEELKRLEVYLSDLKLKSA